jgi:hypothetical protein
VGGAQAPGLHGWFAAACDAGYMTAVLGLPEARQADQQLAAAVVRGWLEGHGGC